MDVESPMTSGARGDKKLGRREDRERLRDREVKGGYTFVERGTHRNYKVPEKDSDPEREKERERAERKRRERGRTKRESETHREVET